MIKKGLQSPPMVPTTHIRRRSLRINKQKRRLKIQRSESRALGVGGPILDSRGGAIVSLRFPLRLLWFIYQHAYLKGRNNGAHFYQKSLQAISNHFRAANFIIAEENIDCNQMPHICSVENWTKQLRSTNFRPERTHTYTNVHYKVLL